MTKSSHTIGIEINPKLLGVFFADRIGDTLRMFCFYTNNAISQFDVPAAENQDNLRAIFSKFQMEETCTSIIMEEAVQGRIYLKHDDRHWSYTMLKSPVNTMPPLNADLAELDWTIVWRTQDLEVLRFGLPGDAEHCYAIRTQISEADSHRLMKNSNAFTQPVSPRRKKSRRWLYVNLAAAALVVSIVIGAAIIQTVRENNHPPVQTGAASFAPAPAAGYYLLSNHQISGPYALKVIADMKNGGLLGAGTMFRAENSADWSKLEELPLNSKSK